MRGAGLTSMAVFRSPSVAMHATSMMVSRSTSRPVGHASSARKQCWVQGSHRNAGSCRRRVCSAGLGKQARDGRGMVRVRIVRRKWVGHRGTPAGEGALLMEGTHGDY